MGAVSRGRMSAGGLIGVFTAEKRFRPVALFVAEAEAIAAAVFQKRRPAGEAGFVARLGRDALGSRSRFSALAAEKRAHIVDGLRVMIILSRHNYTSLAQKCHQARLLPYIRRMLVVLHAGGAYHLPARRAEIIASAGRAVNSAALIFVYKHRSSAISIIEGRRFL